ncbi:MAG: alpha/beta hydrolase family protein [Natronosporangium sp.]
MRTSFLAPCRPITLTSTSTRQNYARTYPHPCRESPKSESDQIVERLRTRGVEVRYDVYPDEGHGFVRRENAAKRDSDSAEFLLAHLRPT